MPIKTYQKYLVAIIPLLIVGFIGYYFSDILTYIILAWVVSMVGAPINGFLKQYLGKSIAAIATLFTFMLLFIIVLSLFIPPIVQQARNFANIDYNELVQSLEQPVNDWNDWLVNKGIMEATESKVTRDSLSSANKKKNHIDIIQVDSILTSKGDSVKTGITLIINLHEHDDPAKDQSTVIPLSNDTFFDQVKKNLYSFLNPSKIPELFGSLVGFFGNLMVAILAISFIAFFFLKEHGLFSKIVKALVPNEFEDQTVRAIDQSSALLIRYFIGIGIQIAIITLYVTSVLSFLGFKNALLIGFFAALMNVIPYIGPLLGFVFGMIITISSNLGVPFYPVLVPMLAKLIAVFASMQLMDNLILQPNIFSKSVKAHPLEIFIIILVGAKLGGILGMVLAIPIYTILRVLSKVFLSEFKIVQKITINL